MGLFGLRKKPVAAELAGRNLTALMIEADDCWEDVCALRSYKTDGTVATCEMAFARAALTKSILNENQHPAIAERITQAADALLLESFAGEDTEVTLKFYGETLDKAAPRRVSLYLDNVFPTSQLASVLGSQLGVPGPASIEVTPLFDAAEARVRMVIRKARFI